MNVLNSPDTDHGLIKFVIKICGWNLFIPTSVKLAMYFTCVVAASILGDTFTIPYTSLANKKNIVNLYFIKLGWGWTLAVVVPYIFLTTRVYCFRNAVKIFQHLTRLAVGTILWYACTTLFIQIGQNFGTCTQQQYDDKFNCLKAGETWHGFDISGHIFLEMHCLLIISEEVQTFKAWTKLGEILHDEDLHSKRNLTDEEISQAQKDYRNVTPYVKILIIFLSIIIMLFEFMLLISAIYRFHTIPQKIVALLVAIFCWFISYGLLYKSGNPYPFMPILPGHCCLQFMNNS